METLRENLRFRVRLVRSVGPEQKTTFTVVDGDECVFTSAVEAAAVLEYEELLYQRRAPVRALQERDRAEAQARALRSETVDRTYKKTSLRGGKGGRGGV